MMSSDLDYGVERWPSDDWWVSLPEADEDGPPNMFEPKT